MNNIVFTFLFSAISKIPTHRIDQRSLVYNCSGNFPICIRDLELCVLCDSNDNYYGSIRTDWTKTPSTTWWLWKQ